MRDTPLNRSLASVPAPTPSAAGRLRPGAWVIAAAGVVLSGLLIWSPMFYAGAIGGVAVTLVILLRPWLGFALTVLTIPLEASGNLGNLLPFINVTPAKIFAGLTMAAFAVHVLQRHARLVWTREATLLMIFFGIAVVSVAGSNDRSAGYQALIRLGSTCAFYLLAANMMRDVRDVRRAIVLLVAASTLTFGFAIAQRFMPSMAFDMRSGWDTSDQRFGVERQTVDAGAEAFIERSSGTSVHSIIMAVNTAIVVAPLVALMETAGNPPQRLLAAAASAIAAGAAAASFSRTGFLLYLALLAALVILGVLRITPLRLGLAGTAALLAFALAPAPFRDRILSLSSYSLGGSESLQIRAELWRAGVGIVGDNPLFGMGLGNTVMLREYWDHPLNGGYMTVHNAYLQVAMEVGLPGLVVLIWFFALTLRVLYRAVQRLRHTAPREAIFAASLLCGIGALLVAGSALDFMNQSFKNAWLYIATSAAFARISDERPEHPG